MPGFKAAAAMAYGVFNRYTQKPMAHLTRAVSIALRKFSPVRLGNNVVKEVAQGVKEHEGGADLLRRAGWGVADTFFPGIKNWGKRWSEEN